MSAESKNEGLYEKFIVQRTDGRSEPGRKHYGCRYFVIDIDHDERAAPALAAYARAARADGDVRLADDLEQLVGGQERGESVPIEWQTQEEFRRDYPPPQDKEGAE